MSKDGFKKLNVFIASPSDVVAERERLISVIQQLNGGLADNLGIVLEVKEWSQVIPTMGRGQKVIFDQLPVEQWDIMIGILWLRYGMSSGGSNPEHSGTHEEFNNAYKCWQKTERPRIMFYRCTRPLDDITKIDTVSLTKINNFFKQFETGGENQGLYRSYNTTNEFEDLVRNHLEKILMEYSGSERGKTSLNSNEDPLKSLTPIREVLSDYYDELDSVARQLDAMYGVPTGFIDLDKMIRGMQPSNLLTVASRSSQSKTSFLLSVARNAALTYKKRVVIFLSLGMSNLRVVQHLIAQETGIASQLLTIDKLQNDEWPLVNYAIELIGDAHIVLDDTPALTMKQLNEKSRRLISEYPIDLIIVDNLQFMSSEDNKRNQAKDLDYISLKILAHDLNIPILTGVQLSRNTERRRDKRPDLSDLQEFGSLEDSADVIMFIHHPEQDGVDTSIASRLSEKWPLGW